MAGKLSRIAQHGCRLLAAGMWLLVAASALGDDYVRVSSKTTTVENPFATSAQETAAPAQPSAAETGPRTYQNPFAAQPGASARSTSSQTLPLGPGPISRWRIPAQQAPTIPLRASNHVDPIQAAQQPQGAVPMAASVVARSPDRATPPTEGLQSAGNPRAGSGDPRTTSFSGLLEVADLPLMAPPRPSTSTATALSQPAWMLPGDDGRPPAVATASLDAAPEDQIDPFESTEPTTDPLGNGIRFVAPARDAVQPASLASAPDTGTAPQNAITQSSYEQPPQDWLVQAQQQARSADTPEALAAVVAMCRRGLATDMPPERRASCRQLMAWALNRRGELASTADQPDAALADFEAAIELDPQCWLALHNRGVSYALAGRTEEALGDFNRAIAVNPGLAVAYRNRGELLAALDRTEEAIRDYTQAIAQVPDNAELYMMRGHAWHRLGDYERALKDLDRAIELAPTWSAARTHRGNVHAERGDFQEAIDDFRQSLRLDPNYAEAYRSVAWLLATCPDPQVRDPQQAVAAGERAKVLCPQPDCYVLDALAAAYASAGQFTKAVQCQQHALAVAPDDFAASLRGRLELYQQRQPFRNARTTGVQPASYERKR